MALILPALALAAPDPQNPQAADAPQSIMRVAQALDRIPGPLADVTVYVPDTGLDLSHPDLAGRLFALPAATPVPNPDGADSTVAAGAPGWDFLGTPAPGPLQPDADPSDVGGHGTLVAGVLGAQRDNGVGAAGLAPNARLMAMRTCWPDDQCYQNVQAAATRWAADRGARVVSMSWLTGPFDASGFDSAIRNSPNALFVAIPSGNGGATDADPDASNRMPCALDSPNVLCVSTSSPTDGLDCGDYGAKLVDVAVPTQGGVTTSIGGFVPTGCATSFAAPTAAGVATILFGLDPTATPVDVKAAILDSARRVPAWAGKSVTGGIVDAEDAVVLFASRRGIPLKTPGGGPPSVPPPPQTSPPAPLRPGVSGPARVLAPSLARPLIVRLRRPAGSVRISARIDPRGALTTWTIERRRVRRTRTGKKVTAFTTLRAGRLPASAPPTTVSITVRIGGPVAIRVRARNRAGAATSVTVSRPAL